MNENTACDVRYQSAYCTCRVLHYQLRLGTYTSCLPIAFQDGKHTTAAGLAASYNTKPYTLSAAKMLVLCLHVVHFPLFCRHQSVARATYVLTPRLGAF